MRARSAPTAFDLGPILLQTAFQDAHVLRQSQLATGTIFNQTRVDDRIEQSGGIRYGLRWR